MTRIKRVGMGLVDIKELERNMVDMSSAAVTERLRLMGELCDKMLNEKRVAEETANAELEAEIVESDEDTGQNRER